MQPSLLKSTSVAEMIASAKAKKEAYDKLSPEEKAEQDRATAEILKKLRPNGPVVLRVK